MCCVQEAALLNGSPLRQHQSSSRGRPGSSGAGSDRSSLVYTRMIRMAAAIQQVNSTGPGLQHTCQQHAQEQHLTGHQQAAWCSCNVALTSIRRSWQSSLSDAAKQPGCSVRPDYAWRQGHLGTQCSLDGVLLHILKSVDKQHVHVYVHVLWQCLQDLEYDRRLQEVPRLLPSSLSLPGITAGEYCVNYVQQLRQVLHKNPPNQPTEMAIDMLAAVAQLQR